FALRLINLLTVSQVPSRAAFPPPPRAFRAGHGWTRVYPCGAPQTESGICAEPTWSAFQENDPVCVGVWNWVDDWSTSPGGARIWSSSFISWLPSGSRVSAITIRSASGAKLGTLRPRAAQRSCFMYEPARNVQRLQG